MKHVTRFPWNHFPDVVIHAGESFVKRHHAYAAAKAGDYDAAGELVGDTLDPLALEKLWQSCDGRYPLLVSTHAAEALGINAIPEAMSWAISELLKWPYERRVWQSNKVNHTGAGGFERLQRQVTFSGPVVMGLNYLLVDDFVGQGGTLANLRGHILAQGGSVIGATVLTGKPYSARLTSGSAQILELRRKHGQIERWWLERFGFGFECLTASEARYLSRTGETTSIIARLEAVGG